MMLSEPCPRYIIRTYHDTLCKIIVSYFKN